MSTRILATICVTNGDDNSTLTVKIQLPLSLKVSCLKQDIMDDPTLNYLFDSADAFDLYHAGKQLNDNTSLLKYYEVECKLRVPEVYRIQIHRELSAKNTSSLPISMDMELGTFLRINQNQLSEDISFRELAVPMGNMRFLLIKTFPIANGKFNRHIRYFKCDDAANSFDIYTFEGQNLYQIRFEIKNSRPDGIYWHLLFRSKHRGKTGWFHRFTKVDTDSHSFMVRQSNENKHDAEMNRLIRGNISTTAQIKTIIAPGFPYNHKIKQVISFHKLTNF